MTRLTRFVNLRPLFVLALEVIVAVIASCTLLLGDPYLYGFVVAFFAVWSVAFMFWHRRINTLSVLFALGIALTLFFPFQIKSHMENRYQLPAQQDVSIVGVASDTAYSSGAYTIVWLEKLRLNGIEVDGKLVAIISGKVDLSNLRAGTRLEFAGDVTHRTILNPNSIDAFSYKNNLRYNCIVPSTSIAFYEDTPTFFSGLRQGIKDTLAQNLSKDIAALSFAMMVGDDTELSSEINYSFRASGITHILSVSGLHVAFLVLMLNFFFKIIGLSRRRGIKLVATSLILLAYIFLCGFAPSVIRASIMSVTYLVVRYFQQRYDMLSAMSISAIAILLLAPIMLFDVGFQLSYLAVLGLASLMPFISNLLNSLFKWKWIKRINSGIAMTVSAQLATIPLCMLYFHTLSMYSVLSNVVIVPLTEIAYIGQMITVPIATIVPSLGIFVKITALPFNGAVMLSNAVSSFYGAMVITKWVEVWAVALFYLVFLLASRYLILRRKIKQIFSGVLIIVMIIAIITYNLPSKPQKLTASMSGIGGSQNIFIATNKQTVLITNLSYSLDTVEFFSKYKKNSVDYIYLTESVELQTLTEFCEILNVKKVYIPVDKSFNLDLYNYEKVKAIDFVDTQEIDGLEFTLYVYNYVYYGIRVSGDRQFFIPRSSADYVYGFFQGYYPECLSGDFLYGQAINGYNYSYYFYVKYVDLVTNYHVEPINDCYIYAL